MKRLRTEERKYFTQDEKQFILDKSDGKCCHCGRQLKIGDNFTVEHAIPLSKGGTNKPWNIVALCKECNNNKADFVINPNWYYRYLKDEHLEELSKHQNKYYSDIEWLDLNSLTKEDFIELSVLSQSIDTMQIVQYGKKRRKYKTEPQRFKFTLNKATYADLDDIYTLTLKYNNEFGISGGDKTIKVLISDIFKKGVIYTLRDSNKNIVSALPLAFTQVQDVFGFKRCILKMYTPVYADTMRESIQAVRLSVEYIIENIKEKFEQQDVIPIVMSYATNDLLLSSTNQYRIGNCYFMPYMQDNNTTYEYAIYETDRCTDENYNIDEEFDKLSDLIIDKLGINVDKLLV